MAEATPLTFSEKAKDIPRGKIEDCVLAPIRRQFTYMCCFKNNIKKLETELEELQRTRELVQRGVIEGRRQVRDTGLNVEAWLNANEVTSNQVGGIIQDMARVNEGCLNGWCPNLKLRYSLSKKAVKNTKVVVDLEAAGFDYVISAYTLPHVENFKALKSGRRLNMEEIIKALKDDQIDLIGICGMAGMGKTTMAKEVAERAKGYKLFDQVAIAMVGKKPNLSKMQASIADVLGLELGDNKKILVILDDVRVEFALDTIGIPLRGANKNVKILYTSRVQDLWHDLQTKKEITLANLSEDEAWQLFREKAGDLADAPHLRPIAKKIMYECGSLPLELVIIGSMLSKISMGRFAKDFWEDMLDQLSCTSDTLADRRLSSSLELSYNNVDDEEGKRLFLLCCLFEDDKSILIEDLARYTLGLSLLDGINKMGEVRRRVFALVDDLKSRYLLLDGENDKCVKVHDIVRHMGISIASKDKGALVCHGEVSEWPKEGTYEHCISMSVVSEEIIELPERLTCTNLEFLLLECKNKKLPWKFFKGMSKLKVLGLSNYDGILRLQSLTNLRTLSLQGFGGQLNNVSAIGDLLNLEILSFHGSSIDELPEEMGELVNLRLLDLDNTWSLDRIPPGVISRLLCLEELYIFHSKFRDWEGEGDKEKGRNANLRELSSANLNTLEICITCDVLIPKVPIFSKLMTYKVLIGDKGGHDRCIKQYKRQLIVTTRTPILPDRGGIDSLLGSSDCLILVGKGCDDLVRELLIHHGVDGIQQLRHLEIHDCYTPEYLANTMYQVQLPAAPTPVVFPILEELKLSALPNLREICRGPVPAGSFGELTKIVVDNCGRLGNLFQLPIGGSLTQLKSLSIRRCYMMKEVILKEQQEDVHVATNIIAFPKLEFFELANLPCLVGFCRRLDQIDFPNLKVMRLRDLGEFNHLIHKNMSSNSEQTNDIGFLSLFPPKVTFPNLELFELKGLEELNDVWGSEPLAFSFFKLKELEVENCESLRNMFRSSVAAGGFINLEKLIIRDCRKMEVVVAGWDEEIEDGQRREIEETLFPQLMELELCGLPHLRRFSDFIHPIDQLSRLSKIRILDCPTLMDEFSLVEKNRKKEEEEEEMEKEEHGLQEEETGLRRRKCYMHSSFV